MSVLHRTAVRSGGAAVPFASYAQIVRMLVPPAERIGFFDAHGQSLWINDGVEEPEFRMHVELAIARARAHRHPTIESAASTEHAADPTHVLAVRDPAGGVVGAVGIVCRNLSASGRYKSADAVERMLAPLLEILGHAWPSAAEISPPAIRDAGTRQAATAAAQLQQSTPTPALLRKALSLATEYVDCAFGAVVAPDRPFTLSHRVSPDESDLTINAAIDNVREHVLKWMLVRNEPLVINTAGNGRTQQLPYKLLVLPIRDASNGVAALIMLFRNARARDFARVDVDELAQIAAGVPADALSPAPSSPVAIVTTREAPKKAAAPSRPAVSKPDTPSAADRPSMDVRIRTALREGAFDLHAQTISPLRETTLSPRFEVLLRMRDGANLYTPASFFGVAENHRLMPELDCWVIGDLLKTLRRRAVTVRTSGLEFSINIAAQSLATEQFSEFIVAEVCRSAIPPSLLVFEVSERTALEHEDAMETLSARLRDVGCRIALDNCRSGLGTLDPLSKWPVSRVKIDGSLIRNIASNSRCESQVRAVVQLAADRGIETVAECVETQSIHERLLDIGIDYAQGFHLGKPRPLQTLFQ